MHTNTKERLLSSINAVVHLSDYMDTDCIFSDKYAISSTDMVYILQKLSDEFNFTINDDFVDAMEAVTFSQFENLLEQHENTNACNP